MAYTNISKPTDSTYTKISKPTPSGVAGVFDFAQFDIATFDSIDDYSRVNKPTDTTNNKIAKPTN